MSNYTVAIQDYFDTIKSRYAAGISTEYSYRGDVHHIFPRNYLKKHGLIRGRYNQIANYVMMQNEINIAVGDKEPAFYFSELMDQCETGELKYGGITNKDTLMKNFAMHCIPDGMEGMTIDDYDDFLQERRRLMAQKMREYYKKL